MALISNAKCPACGRGPVELWPAPKLLERVQLTGPNPPGLIGSSQYTRDRAVVRCTACNASWNPRRDFEKAWRAAGSP
jgi:hypothetical protein